MYLQHKQMRLHNQRCLISKEQLPNNLFFEPKLENTLFAVLPCFFSMTSTLNLILDECSVTNLMMLSIPFLCSTTKKVIEIGNGFQ